MWRFIIALVVLPGSIACQGVLGTEPEPEILRLAVSVIPNTISASDSFDVVVSVINPSNRTQSVVSGCQGGALHQLGVQGPHAVQLEPVIPCIMQSHKVEIPADGLEGQMRMRLYPLDRAVVEPGVYAIHARAVAQRLDDSEAVAILTVE